MIWFFIAGWIAGVAFAVMVAGWWVRKHAVRVTPEEAIQHMENMKEEKSDD